MSKQRPTPDKIANELARGSAFFQQPKPKLHPAAPVEPATRRGQAPPLADNAPHTRTPDRAVRPKRRQMIRHAFELYMDQLEHLRELAALQRERGELGSMSKMVRDALDRYLADAHAEAD